MTRLIDRIAIVALWALAALGWVLFWYGVAAVLYWILTLK